MGLVYSPVLLLLSWIGSEPASAAQDVLVAKPQLALVWQGRQAPAEVWLVRLTPKDLTYKLSASASEEKVLHAGKGVLGVQLADGDIFRFRSATGLFARYDPVHRSFVVQKEMAQAPSTLTQQAEGTGTTGDEAIRDALRNAVRAAVGVLVEGEVLIKQEDVISDKILTYSDGFVSSYDELSREQKEGLVHVKIRAHVERRKLLADLRTASVSLGAVDGKGLVASALTRKDAQDTAASLLSKSLAELPNLIEAEVRPTTALDYDLATEQLKLFVTVRVNRTKYMAFADSLDSLLGTISLAHASYIMNCAATVGVGDHVLDWAHTPIAPAIRFGPALPGNPKAWCLWMAMRADDRHHTFRLGCYALDLDIASALQGTRGTLRVNISLLGANDEELVRDSFEPVVGKRDSYWLGWLSPRPRQLVADFPGQSSSALLGAGNLADLAPQVNADMTVNTYMLPMCIAGLDNGNLLIARGIWQPRTVKVAPDILTRMKTIRAKVVFSAGRGSPSETGGR
jgi:hypothetical protein